MQIILILDIFDNRGLIEGVLDMHYSGSKIILLTVNVIEASLCVLVFYDL